MRNDKAYSDGNDAFTKHEGRGRDQHANASGYTGDDRCDWLDGWSESAAGSYHADIYDCRF